MDVGSIDSASTKATLQVQEKASDKCLQYLIKYQESLQFVPSRIATFLDPRYVGFFFLTFINSNYSLPY